MRVYFEKPRTTVGWKGLINDPYLDESFRIDEGLRIARQLLIEINRLGLPAGSEFLDVIIAAVHRRPDRLGRHRRAHHREPGAPRAGLGPVGADRLQERHRWQHQDRHRRHPGRSWRHHFLSVHKNGQVAIVQTKGNTDCHVILRGGKAPNYDAASVAAACAGLAKAKLPATLMVDCSHANSSKQHEKQLDVAADIAAQLAAGSPQRVRRDGGKPPACGRAEVHARARTTRGQAGTMARASPTPAWAGTIPSEVPGGVVRGASRRGASSCRPEPRCKPLAPACVRRTGCDGPIGPAACLPRARWASASLSGWVRAERRPACGARRRSRRCSCDHDVVARARARPHA